MTSLPTVFVTYNPHSELEQTLAIRLHSIGAVHGFNMLLPDRTFGPTAVSLETRSRILSADFFILFSTEQVSEVVVQEISIAFEKLQKRSRILVVYDQNVGKNLGGVENCTEVFVNTVDDPLKIVTEITSKLKAVKGSDTDSFLSSLGGLLMVGAGLFALSELFSETPQRRRKRKSPRKTARKRPA